MAKKPLDQFEDAPDVDEEDDLDPEDIDEDDLDDEDLDDGDLDEDDIDDDEDLDEEDEDEDNDDDDNEEDEDDPKTVTLDALEAEELETVETNDPATILVDEASEIKALRRKEMAIDVEDTQRVDEFVCSSCFLLLKNVQLADPAKMLCADCA